MLVGLASNGYTTWPVWFWLSPRSCVHFDIIVFFGQCILLAQTYNCQICVINIVDIQINSENNISQFEGQLFPCHTKDGENGRFFRAILVTWLYSVISRYIKNRNQPMWLWYDYPRDRAILFLYFALQNYITFLKIIQKSTKNKKYNGTLFCLSIIIRIFNLLRIP